MTTNNMENEKVEKIKKEPKKKIIKKKVVRKKKKEDKMIENLIIVESPTKAKTITQFLGKEYSVESSYGHMRDLPKSELGVDVEKNYQPRYIIPKKAQKKANALKKKALFSKKIILATDEDREGEAIAWHLKEFFGIDEYDRIVFHEITPSAIETALKEPRKIDEKLVDAQQARRVLDRLVGYNLSPFLWKKIRRGLSAGRVQSVALRLIVEREEERRKFDAKEYWTIEANLSTKNEEKFVSDLSKINDKKLDKFDIENEKMAEDIKKDILEADNKFKILSLTKKEAKKSPLPPFTTSSLQQEAGKKFGFSAKQTMRLAQMLYEGIKIDNKQTGLITYMRTDSQNLAEVAISSARKFIEKKLGKNFLPLKPNYYKSKSKMAQEAHEAIRPTQIQLSPDSIKSQLEPKLFKLYQLIWQRTIACQMNPAIFERTSVDIFGEGKKDNYLFKTNGNILKFPGFLSVYPTAFKDQELPLLNKDDELRVDNILPIQHFTQPPARFSEATLIKALEENGIGRPSTFAPTISVIQDRFYVEKDDDRRLYPTKLGEMVNNMLVNHFPEIVDINFTAKIEDDFDSIAQGNEKWQKIVGEFYIPFKKNLDKKYEEVEKLDVEEKTDEVCEKCGKPMKVKWSRFGKFLGCSGFPECKTIKKMIQNDLGIKCPTCKEGDVVRKRTKAKKRLFYGCSRWPDCDFVSWKKPTPETQDAD